MHHFGRLPIVLLLFGGMMAFRIWRMSRTGHRPRGLRLDRLWIIPAIMAVLVALLLSRTHLQGETLLVAAAAVLGGAVGWWRGGMMRISINPRTNLLMQEASPLALLFLLGLFVVRFGLHFVLATGGARHIAIIATSALAVFGLAMVTLQRLEMFLRARRLLAGHAATPVG
jgi:hypothetical protein